MFPWCKDSPQIVMLWWEWLGRLKWHATRLDASVLFCSASRRCSRKRSASLLPVEMQVKWSVTLTDRLGPEILTVLEIKGQVLHRVRLHVKVPGWLLNLNALLTKKLPKFLSRLNEMSGGRENMCLVSGSLRRILKFSRMTVLIARFCGW